MTLEHRAALLDVHVTFDILPHGTSEVTLILQEKLRPALHCRQGRKKKQKRLVSESVSGVVLKLSFNNQVIFFF